MTEGFFESLLHLKSMISKWCKLEEKSIFQGTYTSLILKTFRLPNGLVHEYEISQGHRSAVVLAFTQDGLLIVEKQFRAGPEMIGYELPAGILEEGELPLEGIIRELGEETGYTGDFEFVTKAYPSAYSNAVEYVFVAKNCHKEIATSFDECEHLETILMTLTEFRQLLKSGKVLNPHAAYLGLDYLNLL